jgi:hypothetical protein
MFREEFLGRSENARQCKILNPKVIGFDYDELTTELTASSSDYIEIENKALGYKIKYQLTNFTKDYSKGFVYFEGYAFFEDLPGSKSQISRWKKNRMSTYDGSSMQFLRSVIANRLKDDAFKILRLIRKPNPDYKGGPNNRYIETLVTTPLELNDFVQLTAIKGQYALSFKDCLCIMHEMKPAHKGDTELIPQYLNTIVTLVEPYAYFDNNGIIINPQSTTFEGEWGKSRVADLLPVDYEPLK